MTRSSTDSTEHSRVFGFVKTLWVALTVLRISPLSRVDLIKASRQLIRTTIRDSNCKKHQGLVHMDTLQRVCIPVPLQPKLMVEFDQFIWFWLKPGTFSRNVTFRKALMNYQTLIQEITYLPNICNTYIKICILKNWEQKVKN